MRRSSQRPSTNLATLRTLAGLTRKELAELANVSPRTIAYAEDGAVPQLATQIKIARALDFVLKGHPMEDRHLLHTDLWPLVDAELAA